MAQVTARRSVTGDRPGLNGEGLGQFQIMAQEGWARSRHGIFSFLFLGVVHLQRAAFRML
jgi:hypothetical protein